MKTTQIQIRISSEQKLRYEQAATADKMSLSEWLRSVADVAANRMSPLNSPGKPTIDQLRSQIQSKQGAAPEEEDFQDTYLDVNDL